MRQGAAVWLVAKLLLFAMPCGAADEGLEARTESWRQDLRFFVTQLREHHRNPFHLVTQQQFESAVTALDTQIPQLGTTKPSLDWKDLLQWSATDTRL